MISSHHDKFQDFQTSFGFKKNKNHATTGGAYVTIKREKNRDFQSYLNFKSKVSLGLYVESALWVLWPNLKAAAVLVYKSRRRSCCLNNLLDVTIQASPC
jgi:hypothetical protein